MFPVAGQGALVKAGCLFDIALAGPDQNGIQASPEKGPKAHGAGLGAGRQAGLQARFRKPVAAGPLLCQGEGQHLRVGQGAVRCPDHVHPDRQKAAIRFRKDRGPEGSPGGLADIALRQGDGQAHAKGGVRVPFPGHLRFFPGQPVGQVQVYHGCSRWSAHQLATIVPKGRPVNPEV